MITMEPMLCAVDDKTFDILFHWLGREVTDKLLYEGGGAIVLDSPPLGDHIAPDTHLLCRTAHRDKETPEPAAHSSVG